MNFDELQSNWQQAGGTTKSQTELQTMTKLRNHPTLHRIRIKLLIEIVLLLAFVVLYNTAFDAGDKPLWANLVLITSTLLFIVNGVMGYVTLQRLPTERDVRQSIETLLHKLQRLSVFSVGSSLLFSIAVILFFTLNIHFTTSKYFVLAGMGTTLFVLLYFSHRNWLSRIQHIRYVLEDLDSTEMS